MSDTNSIFESDETDSIFESDSEDSEDSVSESESKSNTESSESESNTESSESESDFESVESGSDSGTKVFKMDLADAKNQYPGNNIKGNIEMITFSVNEWDITLHLQNVERYPKKYGICLEVDATKVPKQIVDEIENIIENTRNIKDIITSILNISLKTGEYKTLPGQIVIESHPFDKFVEKLNLSVELCYAWGLTDTDSVVVAFHLDKVYVRRLSGQLASITTLDHVKALQTFAMSLIVEDDFSRYFKYYLEELLKLKWTNKYCWAVARGRVTNIEVKTTECIICPIEPQHQEQLFAFDFCYNRIRDAHCYCCVCHDPMDYNLQAFKPFVCNKPLCFMQLAELGFGSSLEVEISNSPKTVDILVSLAYVSLTHPRLSSDWTEYRVKSAINKIPPIEDLKRDLSMFYKGDKSLGKNRLSDLLEKDSIEILRYIVAICRSHIVSLEPHERIGGLEDYEQFKIVMSHPVKEERFQHLKSNVASKYQSLFAFHGSPLGNWFTILVNGLNYEKIRVGRMYGNGIYMAREVETSVGYSTGYSTINHLSTWKNGILGRLSTIVSLNEVINRPKEFVSTDPYFVVNDVDWVEPRYLLVSSNTKIPTTASEFIEMDPAYRIQSKKFDIKIPKSKLLTKVCVVSAPVRLRELTDLMEPSFASPTATKIIHKELVKMLKIQKDNNAERMWEIDVNNFDSLYRWSVRLFNFDKTLPISKDMEKYSYDGIQLEILFGPNYPMIPPFIRVVKPRFVPFMEGGGGHVTAGGSICSTLLTNEGWLPTYSIETVLMHVFLDISSTDPNPARLIANNSSYSLREAVDAFQRVASKYGWTINSGWKSHLMDK